MARSSGATVDLLRGLVDAVDPGVVRLDARHGGALLHTRAIQRAAVAWVAHALARLPAHPARPADSDGTFASLVRAHAASSVGSGVHSSQRSASRSAAASSSACAAARSWSAFQYMVISALLPVARTLRDTPHSVPRWAFERYTLRPSCVWLCAYISKPKSSTGGLGVWVKVLTPALRTGCPCAATAASVTSSARSSPASRSPGSGSPCG